MTELTIKKVSKLIKLPVGSKLIGKEYYWNKQGGHAGGKTISRVVQLAKEQGWTLCDKNGKDHPADNYFASGSSYKHPSGRFILTVEKSYGVTADYNNFYIYLKEI